MPNSNSIRESVSRSNSPGSDEGGVTASPTDSNPSMDKPDVTSAAVATSKAKSKDHHTHLYGKVEMPNDDKLIVSIVDFHSILSYLGFGALAALKRKRKKFSRSRNTSPILEPPHSQEADSPAAVCDVKIRIFSLFD